MYGSNGQVGTHNQALVNGPGIVVGRKGTAGEVVWSETDFFPIDTTYYVETNQEKYSLRWLYYLLKDANLGMLQASTGVPGLSRADAYKLKIPVPEKHEQKRIASTLDNVDQAITATQASIDSAQKLKQALMQNLLTGKLKPDGTWRQEDEFDSHPKFGWAPKGWLIKTIKDVFDVNENTLGASTAPDFGFRYIELELVDTQVIDYEAAKRYLFSDSPGRARRQLKDGDFLFSTVRPNLLGFAKFNNPDPAESWVGSTGFAVARPRECEDGDFYFYQMLSEIGQRQLHALVTGSNYPAINDAQFSKLRVLSPPYAEQQEIAKILVGIDKSIVELRRQKLIKLQLLKKALMQNLITGKVRIPPE